LSIISKEAQKAGWSLEAALQECAARGWRGFKADWVQDKPKQSQFISSAEAGRKAAGLSIFGNLENLNDKRIIDIN